MPRKSEDLSALKARVQTYEAELQQILSESQKFAGTWQESLKSPGDEDAREVAAAMGFVSFLQILSRRIDLMEKYEAAQRNYVAALEARVKDLEKKVPKFDLGVER